MTEGFRFNPVHVPAGSSTGGQFGSAPGQTAQQKLAAEKEPSSSGSGKPRSPWRNGVMAFDPKTKQGPGYDSPKGDATVHQLQQALIRLGITDASGKKLADDGKLGPLTTQAVKEAQKRLGVAQTGQVTPELLKQLTGLKSLPAKAPAKPSAVSHPRKPHRDYYHNDEYAWGGGPVGYIDIRQQFDTTVGPSDSQMESQLEELLAALSDDDVHRLATIAEAMHADGGAS